MARPRRFSLKIVNGKLSEFAVWDPKIARRIGPVDVLMNKSINEVADHLTKVLTFNERMELVAVMRRAISAAIARGEDKVLPPN